MTDSYGSSVGGQSKAQGFAETISFLEHLRFGGPWVLTAIIPDGRTITISARTTAEINAFVHEHNGKLNLYYTVNPLRHLMWKKAAKADVAAIEYLSLIHI